MSNRSKKKAPLLYRCIKWLVWLFYPKMKVFGRENLPDGPAVIVGNHAKMNGPIACELYLPDNRYTWCAGQMMACKDVPAYAYADFWSQKPVLLRPFYKLLSYLIAVPSAYLFNCANTIAVYRDARILGTFRETLVKLQEGAQIVIFPEHNVKYNTIVYEFQDKFIELGKRYYKRTGEALPFVPMYIAPRLKAIYLGKPIMFSPEAPIEEERRRICHYLMQEITAIAKSLPEHTVIPYPNIPKRKYPTNRSEEESL
ncbi:MAG: hypothetical protein E7618_00275 [Ruminococcaceae bacterium]|nr:hypothetical protein [Oscillospiraceae bacterium]